MENRWVTGPAALALGIAVLTPLSRPGAQDLPFQRTEVREACDDYEPLRKPLFGDTHIHTSFSIDSFVFDVRNDPAIAYDFSRGAEVRLPPLDANGVGTRSIRIDRPLDFAAVTDHAEGFGAAKICMSPERQGYDSFECRMLRNETPVPPSVSLVFLITGVAGPPRNLFFCYQPGADCDGAVTPIWNDTRDAAEAAYDRTSACGFTTFVAYEWTPMPGGANLHRNVIFRNERNVDRPIDYYETETFQATRLWELLRERCLDQNGGVLTETAGCDVLTIPHNSNQSMGLMFPDPLDAAEARERDFFEPIAETFQYKGSSECRFDRTFGLGTDTTDEDCSFEISEDLLLVPFLGPSVPKPSPAFPRRSFLRNVLKDGLAIEQRIGVNPFRLGLIGSTDTHNGTPGAVSESAYQGHAGVNDPGDNRVSSGFLMKSSPGGLAVVWAEENSRDSIFEAMRRREVYGTSGTRPVIRFFGGWDYPEDLCGNPDLVSVGYGNGVPMGGTLGARPGGAGSPEFVLSATMDPGVGEQPGTPLQRAQIVKGWVDALGLVHEKVFEVAGGPNGASVDPATCIPVGAGESELCTVWQDPEFDATQGAFYYARVIENPVCRWSTYSCKAIGVDPFSAQCAGGDRHECCRQTPFLQERAWTSPIWYRPG